MNNKLEVIGIDHGWSMMKTIVSADGLDTVYHKAGDKVATIVTNERQKVQITVTKTDSETKECSPLVIHCIFVPQYA